MPNNRPRVSAENAPSLVLIATTFAVMSGLVILLMWSGAIEALNASGLLGINP